MTSTVKKWSDQQDAIFGWFRSGKGNAVVEARAGTGKTTTILEGISHAPEDRILVAAFNKRIQLELNERLRNPRAEAKTLHGVGFACVLRNWNGTRIDEDRGRRLVAEVLTDDVPDEIARLVLKLAARAKSTCPFPTLDDMVSEAEDADLMPEDEHEENGWDVRFVAQKAMEAMDLACKRDGTIDYDDMVFVPLRNKWVFGRWNLIVIDEAQDMSYSQLLLAQRSCKKGGRICVVGDNRQAIYGFRGADSRSIDRLKTALKATVLKLTITYRCPKQVVSLAQRIVPDFEAAPTAPEGVVESITKVKLIEAAQPGDFVLSRANAPLATTCLAFLRANKRAYIEGRDVGKTLIALVKKLKGKSIPDFIARLHKWQEREVVRAQKLPESKRQVKESLIADQVDTLVALVDGLSGVSELVARIETLFADMAEGKKSNSFIVCSSVHRAKGLERENVFLLEPTFSERSIEEKNIKYVAITRSKQRLVWVVGDDKKDATETSKEPAVLPASVDPIAEAKARYIEVGMKHHGDDFFQSELDRQGIWIDPNVLK